MRFLESAGSLVRPLTDDDYDIVHALWTDPAVRAHLGGVADDGRVDGAFAAMLDAADGDRYFVVEAATTGRKAGLVSIDDYHLAGEKELSYQFLPEVWGSGVAFSSLTMILDEVIIEGRLGSIHAETQARNDRSNRLLLRLGFGLVGTLERYGEAQNAYRKRLRRG